MISTRKNTVGRPKKIRIITKDTLSRPKKQDLTSTSSNIEPAGNFQKRSTHIASDTGINGTMPTELKEKTEIIFNGFGIFSAKKC